MGEAATLFFRKVETATSIEVPIVALEGEEGFLFGGGGDLVERVDYGGVLGIRFLSFGFHGE